MHVNIFSSPFHLDSSKPLPVPQTARILHIQRFLTSFHINKHEHERQISDVVVKVPKHLLCRNSNFFLEWLCKIYVFRNPNKPQQIWLSATVIHRGLKRDNLTKTHGGQNILDAHILSAQEGNTYKFTHQTLAYYLSENLIQWRVLNQFYVLQ